MREGSSHLAKAATELLTSSLGCGREREDLRMIQTFNQTGMSSLNAYPLCRLPRWA
jgi:hypothetical protein